MKTTTGIYGRVRLEIFRADSQEKIRDELLDNLIPIAGQNAFRDAMGGFRVFPIGIGIGTSTTPVSAADAKLGNEVLRLKISRRIRPRDGAIRFQAFLLEGDSNDTTLTEAGLFNSTAINNGDMFARVVFGSILKTSQIFVTITWEHEFVLV